MVSNVSSLTSLERGELLFLPCQCVRPAAATARQGDATPVSLSTSGPLTEAGGRPLSASLDCVLGLPGKSCGDRASVSSCQCLDCNFQHTVLKLTSNSGCFVFSFRPKI